MLKRLMLGFSTFYFFTPKLCYPGDVLRNIRVMISIMDKLATTVYPNGAERMRQMHLHLRQTGPAVYTGMETSIWLLYTNQCNYWEPGQTSGLDILNQYDVVHANVSYCLTIYCWCKNSVCMSENKN